MEKNVEMERKLKSSDPGKKTYLQPCLQYYGSVSSTTSGGVGSTTEGGSGAAPNMRPSSPSDPSLKENVVKIGKHFLGIGLYLFDYKPEFRDVCGHGKQFGVMANEVEEVMPEAVSVHPDGYKMVNYAMLGISHNLH